MDEPRGIDAQHIPVWLAAMILWPLVEFIVLLTLEDSSWLIGLPRWAFWLGAPGVAAAGSGLGAMLGKGSIRSRLTRGAGGAVFGFGAFWFAYAAAIGLTFVLK